MKVAVVQFTASTNKEVNLKKIISFISKAALKKATMCAFPEFMMFYTNSSQTSKQLADLAEMISGNFVTTIAKAAKENKIQVIGSFYEKSRTKDRVYDTAFVIDKTGKKQGVRFYFSYSVPGNISFSISSTVSLSLTRFNFRRSHSIFSAYFDTRPHSLSVSLPTRFVSNWKELFERPRSSTY